ncbi:hydroxymethylglutaryl-CoA lyase [Alkalihalobacillus alcalophilus ATCC 27647 = CGMCC 1.3604]|jgi:hydroxymethylglutaryl-CoA lyase|uniref:Hydroxymethylglutaryl-CoA lyase n=1 Tax=Alkalihalobacillus alcalophilus ATCC 27647 = CGMCC 1.3604 TaxID=1218173 RepID=A0A094YYG8_ALKAL|nr:hydroxymethylglutaryl-CoA lyase [Alkalihalobacillus alcalophilus]KGA98582.1 hydroxymethylglutaryl-CoA lyase [Alkalihalobacillus alcalophilus ATCC 27647 = CGMCC 1.3604]MED1560423.1 hydroxymethylglutaryl-CoA lyase [Alkalihalobacillus alcalophilus]THG88979.1 hydroxymethylglutaryl-CoA lyase [Alkalihalobacillus alcalophilus ATCC 27647 = CGMCC 1.3604]
MKWTKEITLKEVGPRDGLQNEKKWVATEDKIAWIDRLSESGLKSIEVTSFVPPKWIPALSDSYEVATQIKRVKGVTYSALVPNQRGLEKAIEAKIDEVAVFMSASETHNQKNIAKSIDETFPILNEVVQNAIVAGKKTRGYISTVFGCPYEGEIDLEQVIKVSEALLESGVDELSLGDTIGIANPKQVEDVLNVLLKRFPAEKVALHFHNTRGLGLANVVVAIECGITTFDCSTAGIGGCPYAPGASGNVATDDLLYMLERIGIETGVNLEKIIAAAQFIESKLGRPLPSYSLQMNR